MSTVPEGTFTLFPTDQRTRDTFPPFEDDPSRVLVRLPVDQEFDDHWNEVYEEEFGYLVMVRRADCGAGCRCAAEVELREGRDRV